MGKNRCKFFIIVFVWFRDITCEVHLISALALKFCKFTESHILSNADCVDRYGGSESRFNRDYHVCAAYQPNVGGLLRRFRFDSELSIFVIHNLYLTLDFLCTGSPQVDVFNPERKTLVGIASFVRPVNNFQSYSFTCVFES